MATGLSDSSQDVQLAALQGCSQFLTLLNNEPDRNLHYVQPLFNQYIHCVFTVPSFSCTTTIFNITKYINTRYLLLCCTLSSILPQECARCSKFFKSHPPSALLAEVKQLPLHNLFQDFL